MDGIDRNIAGILEADCRLSNAEIGARVGLSVSSVSERIRKLTQNGVITGFHAKLDPETVDKAICAFLFVDLAYEADWEERFVEAVVKIPEVLELHHVSGAHSYLLKVRVSSPRNLENLLTKKIKKLPGFVRSELTISLNTHKEASSVLADERE